MHDDVLRLSRFPLINPLAIYETLELRRISVSLNLDCRDNIMDCLQIFRSQFYLCAAKILL